MKTHEVIAQVIKPATAEARVSYAELLGAQVDEASGVPFVSAVPQCMISHAWACPFATFLGAIEAHVAEQPGGGARYYMIIDMFALNQHALASVCATYAQDDGTAVFALLRDVLSGEELYLVHKVLTGEGQQAVTLGPGKALLNGFRALELEWLSPHTMEPVRNGAPSETSQLSGNIRRAVTYREAGRAPPSRAQLR